MKRKVVLTITVLLFASYCSATINFSKSHYLGKFGLSSSGVAFGQPNGKQASSCVKKISDEKHLNLRLRLYATCKNYDILKDNKSRASIEAYSIAIKEMKLNLKKLVTKEFNLDLKVVLLMDSDYFNKNVYSLAYDKYKMTVGVQYFDLNNVPEYTSKNQILMEAVNTTSHEFFHHYVDRVLAKQEGQKSIRKNSNIEEAVATITGLCVGALTIDGSLVTSSYHDVYEYYQQGKDVNQAFKLSKIGEGVTKSNNKQYIDAVKSYIIGIYSMWDQFGAKISSEERIDFLKYCSNTVNEPMTFLNSKVIKS